jgi:lipoprotein-anchoring transpeptidase ErfK/SrfK
VLAEEADRDDGDPAPWYRIDGGRYAGARLYSGRAARLPDPRPNTAAPGEGATGRWVVVDRAATTLTVVRDGEPEFATYVSLGRAGVDTPSGLYRISNKLEFDDMRSDRNPTADRSYYLPGVPHVQYFSEGGDAIHGTYWHDRFGTQESQGCINLTMADGAYVFGLTEPSVAGGEARWSAGSSATPLMILD